MILFLWALTAQTMPRWGVVPRLPPEYRRRPRESVDIQAPDRLGPAARRKPARLVIGHFSAVDYPGKTAEMRYSRIRALTEKAARLKTADRYIGSFHPAVDRRTWKGVFHAPRRRLGLDRRMGHRQSRAFGGILITRCRPCSARSTLPGYLPRMRALKTNTTGAALPVGVEPCVNIPAGPVIRPRVPARRRQFIIIRASKNEIDDRGRNPCLGAAPGPDDDGLWPTDASALQCRRSRRPFRISMDGGGTWRKRVRAAFQIKYR